MTAAYTLPPPAAYAAIAPPIPATVYQPSGQPTHQQSKQGRGSGKRSRNRAAFGAQPPIHGAYPAILGAIPVPAYGASPPATGGGRAGYQSNNTKYYNNHNVCFVCGWDVPGWHTSKTCLHECCNAVHMEEVNQLNAPAYTAAGHRVSTAAAHKTLMPVNPGPCQA